jgi:HEAT repeat protein
MKPMTPMVVLLLLMPLSLPEAGQGLGAMQEDVDRLARAAANLTEMWPTQAPPPVPEVALVARRGRAVVPLLMNLLSDDPATERSVAQWKVQQQATLALCVIYAESAHCGRVYCDGDAPERIAQVRRGWQRVVEENAALDALSPAALLDRFKGEAVFWRQLEVAKALAATREGAVVAALEPWLRHEDRHVRGNAAFVLGRLGDRRGFETIAAMLVDRAPRPPGQGIPRDTWSVEAQIRADRYYAAHLLGDLKDPRGAEILTGLMDDPDVSSIVPWSLGEIGDGRAIGPLIAQLDRDEPSRRVQAILGLVRLKARQAVPRLRELLQDARRPTAGDGTSVAEAARHAIAVLSQVP